jgi:type III pantothenate kinase
MTDDASDQIASRIPSVLALDVGNTAVHFAHVHGQDVTPMRTLPLADAASLENELRRLWETIPPPRKLVASSVNPRGLPIVEEAARRATGEAPLVVGRDLPLPMGTLLPDPRRVGTDRICAAVAAFDQIGAACVVADFGTAATIDCVNAEGKFMGGAILPGAAMGARGLHEHTSQLPLVEPAEPDWVYGRDTKEAIIGGIVFGLRGALRELVETYATDLGQWPVVILTGGDARLICRDPSQSELVQAVVPDLVLRGVAIAYYKTLLK